VTVDEQHTTSPGPLTETLRRRRGHRFYPTAAEARAIPGLYETEDVPAPDKTLHVHYFVGGSDWWIAEYDPETGMAFGYACLGDPQGAEWGYPDLTELEAVAVQRGVFVVERDLHWAPVKARDAKLPSY
jgi:hypothetical protein